MAFARHNTIADQRNRRNMEIAEMFAFLWNGFLILVLGLFIPFPVFLGLLAAYSVGCAVYSVFKQEIQEGMFRFFDNVASFFGYPPPELPQPIEQAPPDMTPPMSPVMLDRGFIQRRLRSSSEPLILHAPRRSSGEPVEQSESKQSIRQRQTLWQQIPQEILLQEMKHIATNKTLQKLMYFNI